MDMAGVVPVSRKARRRAVEDDPAADEDDALDETFDGAELVRDIEDGHAQLAVELAEEGAEGLLCVHVHSGGGLVEYEELGLAGEGLGDVGALLQAS
jgi:hypothetical protein